MPIPASQISAKRSLLLSARVQFSPQTQPIRETAIDKIVEQTLFASATQGGLSKTEILDMGNVCFKDPVPTLRIMDIDQALARLQTRSRISKTQKNQKYKLTDVAQQELQRTQELIETRFSSVVGRLFRCSKGSPTNYSEPFLDCLCAIFSRLAETYVRLIKGDINREYLTGAPELLQAIQDVSRKHSELDSTLLAAGVIQFFRESDPDFDAIKWNMAQNYYVAKVLGIDQTGYLLSEQVFGNSIFYLDTNVIIQALEPTARHHRSFEALSKACASLSIELNVCKISLDELERVVFYQRTTIEKVHNQIPRATVPKVQGIFFQLYEERLESYGTVDFDELFASFTDPLEILRNSYNVHLVDDKWFLEAEGSSETSALAAKIRHEYFAKRRKTKATGSSLHDACMLRWVNFERQTSPQRAWFITLDTSLPYCAIDEKTEDGRPLAITLAAFLQWISPITVLDQITDEVASIFSEAMKYQLLPRESFFELRDFLMFAEMDLSCKELPSEDVEGCIRFIKATAPSLDPSIPSHREKLSHEIAKFMSDPGRKYKQELSALETKISQITTEAVEMNDQMREKLQEQINTITKLQDEIGTLKNDIETRRLRRSAFTRLALIFIAWVATEMATVYWGAIRPDPTHWLDRVTKLWQVHTFEFALALVLSALILGEKRIRSLGWPFTKLLKVEG